MLLLSSSPVPRNDDVNQGCLTTITWNVLQAQETTINGYYKKSIGLTSTEARQRSQKPTRRETTHAVTLRGGGTTGRNRLLLGSKISKLGGTEEVKKYARKSCTHAPTHAKISVIRKQEDTT